MATKKFTYPLPDEIYFPEVSGKNVGEFTYEGPDTFTVRLNEDGYVIGINPFPIEGEDPNRLKEIDANLNPEVAYLIYCAKDSNVHIFEDEIMEDGSVYKKITNPTLHEAYDVFYDYSKESWELSVIVKELYNPAKEIANRNKEYIKSFADKYAFSDEIESKISLYISNLDDFISNLKDLPIWKYVDFNFDVPKIPKMPVEVAQEIAKIKDLGV